MARAGRGTAQFTVEGERMAPKILKQLKQCHQPSVEDLKVEQESMSFEVLLLFALELACAL